MRDDRERRSVRGSRIAAIGLCLVAVICTVWMTREFVEGGDVSVRSEEKEGTYFERDDARSLFHGRLLDGDDDDDDGNCTHYHSTCSAVRQNCPLGSAGTQLFNYYTFYYCTMESVKWLGFVCLVAWLLIVFSLLASTADSFFVLQLETISAKLRLSPTIAGITLCAIGNSAPDVFSDLAAVQNANDFALALGELVGASMFLTTVVLGAVILVATKEGNDAAVNGFDFVRDVSIFMIALLMLLVFSLTEKKIYLYEAVAIIGLYLFYIVIVVVHSYYYDKDADLHRMQTMPPDPNWKGSAGTLTDKLIESESGGSSSAVAGDDAAECQNTKVRFKLDAGAKDNESGGDDGNAEEDRLVVAPGDDADIDDEDDDEDRLYGIEWRSTDSLLDKLVFVVELPFSVLRWASIASAHPSHWDWRRRYLACLTPFGTICIIFLDFSGNWQSGTSWEGFQDPEISKPKHFSVSTLCMILSLLCGVVIFFTTNNDRVPDYHWLLVVLAFVSTVAWLDLIGNECVAVLEALGTITGLSNSSEGHSIMGITFLAWANSIGDFVADTAIARTGKVKMAIASTFGSPLLTACLGLGIATVAASSSNSDLAVDSKFDGELWISYIFIGLSLGSSLAVISYFNFNVPRVYAFYLFGLYMAYMLVSVLHLSKVF